MIADSAAALRDTKLGLVVIGRNEGERLLRCLGSIRAVPCAVYVDSGSTDGSVAAAAKHGVAVVEIGVPPPFTAARARNAGLKKLLADGPELEFVQTLDGDCEMRSGWVEAGLAALRAESDLAAVFGRTRERHPERSIYNALCDDEWNVPIGIAAGCGGIALYRAKALREVNFFNPGMIAGEDTELAMRLRKAGWRIRRIDAEMAIHDANITHFSQWWTRMRRAGHAFAEMAFLHPDARDPNWPATVRSIAFWGILWPLCLAVLVLLAILFGGWWWLAAGLGFTAWWLNLVRIALRQVKNRRLPVRMSWASGMFLMLAKLPQALGLASFYRDRLLGRTSRLIEYKGASVP